MKLNISYPLTGLQKVIEVDDEKKLRAFYDKRMSHEVDGIELGEEFKGYILKISGGNDKQGFPMKQGVLTASRVRVLMDKGASCFRPRRRGERKRKSIRGCIVSSELSVLNLVVVKKGEQDIPGLTDGNKPRRRGPKRATRIRKLFNLDKKDDVRKFVIRRQIVKDGKKPYTKAPKIQRLITPRRLQHRRQIRAEKRKRFEKSRQEAKDYNALVAQRLKSARDAKKVHVAKKRSQSRKESVKAEEAKKEAKKKEVLQKAISKDNKKDAKKDLKKDAKDAKKDAKKAAPAAAPKKDAKDAKKAAPAAAPKKDAKAAPAAAAKKDAPKKDAKAAPAAAAKKDAPKAAPAAAPKKDAPKKDAPKAAPAAAPKKDAPKQQPKPETKQGGKGKKA